MLLKSSIRNHLCKGGSIWQCGRARAPTATIIMLSLNMTPEPSTLLIVSFGRARLCALAERTSDLTTFAERACVR